MLVLHDGELERLRGAHHHFGFACHLRAVEVGAHALAQVLCLAHINEFAFAVFEFVNSGKRGQGAEDCLVIFFVHGVKERKKVGGS